jgi:mannan endo-1,4-beta-mannosidase
MKALKKMVGVSGIIAAFLLTAVPAQEGYYKGFYRLPVTPNASPEAKAVLKFLYDISGKNILSGQMGEGFANPVDACAEYVKDKTGTMPALFGCDFKQKSDNWRQKMIDEFIVKWKEEKTIVLASWHATPPDKDRSCGWSCVHVSRQNYSNKIDDIVEPGGSLHDEWLSRMDNIAGFLKQLQEKNVPIILRPFHEMNGGWFWWCNHGEGTKKLWQLMFTHFTQTHKLNNIIWCYSPNINMSYTEDYAYNYPGHEYVDILAHDIYENYGHSYGEKQYKELLEVGDDRPIAIGENGKLPPVDMISKEQPRYIFWLTWNGFQGQKGNTESWYKTVYGHPYVLDQTEMDALEWNPSWDNPTAVMNRKTLSVKESSKLLRSQPYIRITNTSITGKTVPHSSLINIMGMRVENRSNGDYADGIYFTRSAEFRMTQ